MEERILHTEKGDIHYWVSDHRPGRKTLFFLPGLTADHRLFDKQTEEFAKEYNVVVWDAPGHGCSRPFENGGYTLMDKAGWVHAILAQEGLDKPVLIGQSMGGYVGQCFMERYPGEAAGFVSIDSAPLKRKYTTALEIAMLKKTEGMYRAWPWENLKKLGINGTSLTEYGRSLMRLFVSSYTKDEYCALSGHGMRMLAEAMEADLPYAITCPAILIVGEKDNAGSAKGYNKRWSKKEGLPLYWIKDAGHNANADQPDEVNRILRNFLSSLTA